MRYSILTPHVVPDGVSKQKKVNVGDGFILARIERRLFPAVAAHRISIWEPLTETKVEEINSTKALFIAGANQLQDDYMLTRGTSPELVRKITVPIVPFGVGIYGFASRNKGPTPETRRLLIDIHERIPYSSWRCPRTIAYLKEHLPEIADRTLMTSCPVVFDEPVLSRPIGQYQGGRVAVTVTERGDFWDRERSIVDYVASRFQGARPVLVLHQRFDEPGLLTRARRFLVRSKLRKPSDLARYALAAGFEVVAPETVNECWDLYANCELHVGSRLHAHLYFLSQAKPSFLVRVDDRSRGFAESLAFPDVDAEGIRQWETIRFDEVRARILAHSEAMERFTDSCLRQLGVSGSVGR